MKTDFIELTESDSIATIHLCNRRKRNALSSAAIHDLNECVDYINKTNDIKVCILKGEEDFFCAGVDIKELNKITNIDQSSLALIESWSKFSSIKVPTIACVAGYAFGGGFELALMCDLIVASENAIFGFPEVDIGILPGNGGTQRLPAIIGAKRAFEMIATGMTINANTAYKYGIINKIAPLFTEYSVAYGMAKKLVQKPPNSLIAIKSAIAQFNTVHGIEYERSLFAQLLLSDDKKHLTDKFFATKK